MSVYIFESVDIIGAGRGKFVELIRNQWARYAEIRYGVRLAGVWATVGSTGRWPEANLMWEMDDWGHFAKVTAAQYPLEDKDPLLAEMWRQALEWRSGGRATLLVPSILTAQPAQLRNGAAEGAVFLYERLVSRPGELEGYHALLQDSYLPAAEGKGLRLFGAYAHALQPNIGVNLWMMRDFVHYAQIMDWLANDRTALKLVARCRTKLTDCDGWVLCVPPRQRLRT
jgi:hypothetical protein